MVWLLIAEARVPGRGSKKGYGSGLENQRVLKGPVGSKPTPSFFDHHIPTIAAFCEVIVQDTFDSGILCEAVHALLIEIQLLYLSNQPPPSKAWEKQS